MWPPPTDVEPELERIGHELQPLDIVVVNTRAGEVFGKPEYIHAGCGMGREATLYLTERGVRVVGTDAWSWDAPVQPHREEMGEDRDPKIIWEGHKAGREIPLLADGEAAQPRRAAAVRLRDRLLPGEDQRRIGRLVARRGHLRRVDEDCPWLRDLSKSRSLARRARLTPRASGTLHNVLYGY